MIDLKRQKIAAPTRGTLVGTFSGGVLERQRKPPRSLDTAGLDAIEKHLVAIAPKDEERAALLAAFKRGSASIAKARTFYRAVEAFEAAYLLHALDRSSGDVRSAARTLGISASALRAKIRGVPRAPPPAAPARARDMTCRVLRCGKRSRGPRYRFICDEHLDLLTREQQEAVCQAWRIRGVLQRTNGPNE